MRPCFVFLIILALGSFKATASPSAVRSDTKAQTTEASLRKVPAQRVCMVNDQVFEKDQIRIDVDKKAYYGCCEMCQERLGKDAKFRQAVDPVSGKTVDKATAVIGAKADGSVLYFENEANLLTYSRKK
jgi:YHS domain-containing protein